MRFSEPPLTSMLLVLLLLQLRDPAHHLQRGLPVALLAVGPALGLEV